MSKIERSGWVLAVRVVCSLSAHAEVTSVVESACDGNGIAGTLSDGSTTVFFESCGDADDAYSRIWNSDGKMLTEFIVVEEHATFLVGGVEIDEKTSKELLDATGPVFLTPEAALVGGFLFDELRSKGYTLTTLPVPMSLDFSGVMTSARAG